MHIGDYSKYILNLNPIIPKYFHLQMRGVQSGWMISIVDSLWEWDHGNQADQQHVATLWH